MPRRSRFVRLIPAAALLAVAVSASTASAGKLLVCLTRDASQLGYAQSTWSIMTARIDSAAAGPVLTTIDLANLNTMLATGGLWVDLRESQSGTLSNIEAANVIAYLNTGRRVVFIGENNQYASWNGAILGVVGGTFTGSTATGVTPNTSFVPLTAGVATITMAQAGVAEPGGGASLFADRVATTWGPARNALAVLDANAFDDDRITIPGNSAFASNVAAWVTGGASNGPIAWNTRASGNWIAGSSWTAGAMPSIADDAVFALAPDASSAASYTVSLGANGNAVRSLLVPSDRLALLIPASAALVISQSLSLGQTTGASGYLTLTSTTGGAASASAASLSIAGAGIGALTVNPGITLTISGTTAIAAGGSLVLAPSPDPLHQPTILHAATLTFAGDGTLDLANNEMIAHVTATAVRSMLVANTIRTTSTGGALGYMDIGNGDTEVRFTLLADTNLDAKVDVADLGNLAAAYGLTNDATWVQADSNYDGKVDVNDLGNMATNYGRSLSSGAAITNAQAIGAITTATVPEPLSWITLACFAGSASMHRSRRARAKFLERGYSPSNALSAGKGVAG